MTIAGQPAVNNSYDNANRLTQIGQGTSTVAFAYDAAGRTSLTLANGVVMSYSYDAASQLTGLTYTLGATTLGNLSYAYDNAGRRTVMGGSFARTGLPLPVSTTVYNANNQLTTWGTATLTYDANGNMTSDGTNAFTWDARNQLASMNLGAIGFQYDPFGRRVGKIIASTTTNYLYDGANIVQELSGGLATANLLSGGVDEVFTRTDAGGARNFLADALGSVLALADSAGTLQTQYTYEPFGNTTLNGSTTTNSFAYTGRELDGTGLYFYRARYYNPTLQRFVSEDPLGFGGGDVNLYAYVSNSPPNFTDSCGMIGPLFPFPIPLPLPLRKPLSGRKNPPQNPPQPPQQPRFRWPWRELTPKEKCLRDCVLAYAAELTLCAFEVEVPPFALGCATAASIVLTACRNKCNRQYP